MRLLCLGLIPAIVLACGSSESPQPNILLISIDTLRADHLSCYGYGRETSPNIDALAASGVLFEDAHSSSSWTLPGLASLVTGEHASTHGCWNFATRLHTDHVTLAERLLTAGYDTASITTNLFTNRAYGLQQGIVLADEGSFRSEDGPLETAVTSPRVSDNAIDHLTAVASLDGQRPWFLWLHYFDPHDEYLEHEGFSERFLTPDETDPVAVSRDAYDGEILFTDFHIGRVLDALESLGLSDVTVVALVADHGEEFADHGRLHHGHTLHRELTQMPLILRVPGIAPGRVDEIASMVDVFPTLLELAGAETPEGLPGRSLVPFLLGDRPPAAASLSEVRLLEGSRYESIRRGDWTLIRSLDDPSELRLFDQRSDPDELVDVASDHPAEIKLLEALLTGSVSRARGRSSNSGSGSELSLSSDQLDVLKKLGYLGER
jgi:arylsulfatase A-like enzyme